MQKYKYIQLVVFKKTKNKALTNYILSYIKGNGPCKYLKNVVHYHILNELQVFNMSRYHVYQSIPRDDLFYKKSIFKIHKYLINNKTDNKYLFQLENVVY